MISGSAPLLPETFDAFAERTGHTILERYGMTETGMNTSNPLDGERSLRHAWASVAGHQRRVVDAARRRRRARRGGDIQVKGPNVFSGYWRMPDRTREEFTADGYFGRATSATMAADRYLRIIGRAKDLIITGGLNVYPKEIEEESTGCPVSRSRRSSASPHPDFGEAVIAVVVAKPGHELRESDIVAARQAGNRGFKIPKRVYLVDELPRNAMGKVEKSVLRDRYAAT